VDSLNERRQRRKLLDCATRRKNEKRGTNFEPKFVLHCSLASTHAARACQLREGRRKQAEENVKLAAQIYGDPAIDEADLEDTLEPIEEQWETQDGSRATVTVEAFDLDGLQQARTRAIEEEQEQRPRQNRRWKRGEGRQRDNA
jgi:hypothetical protein